MTPQEIIVIEKLVEAWNEFLKLPIQHDDDILEMRQAIHSAQRNIMARPTYRLLKAR